MKGRWQTVLMIGLLFAAVNLPLLHSMWLDRQLEANGIDVVGEVRSDRVVDPNDDPKYAIGFVLDRSVDPDQQPYAVQVDEETYDEAVASREIDVRVIEDDLDVFEVEGQVTNNVALIITLFADLFLIVITILFLRFRSALRAELQLVATEDLTRTTPGAVLERIDGLTYVVAGEVHTIGEDEIVLDLGDRLVRIFLDGHANPVGYQQPARVVGRMVG